jgi:ABC-type polysaccharide/polyol phosphate export permease
MTSMKSSAETLNPHSPAREGETGAAAAEPPGRTSSTKADHVFADLLLALTTRDIKIKYKQSIMGLLWAVLMPMIIIAAGMVVRVAMSQLSDSPMPPDHLASLAVKAIPWAFFVGSIRFATASLTSNMNLVTKINCPRIAFPVSAILSNLFDMFVATVPLIAVLAWLGITPSVLLLWVPVLIAIIGLLVAGMGIALSAANLFYRDVRYIVEVILTFAIFFTPVFYDVEMFGEWRNWLLLNPISPLLEGLRSVVVLKEVPDLRWLAYSTVVSLVVFTGAWAMFRRLEPIFADRV